LPLTSIFVIHTVALLLAIDVLNVGKAYAHFVGGETQKIIDNYYQILFRLSSYKVVVDNDNATKLLFLNILDKAQNTDGKLIFAALSIKERKIY
jgi:hypothetical protein